jgi:hypothetical protein
LLLAPRTSLLTPRCPAARRMKPSTSRTVAGCVPPPAPTAGLTSHALPPTASSSTRPHHGSQPGRSPAHGYSRSPRRIRT